MGAFKHRLGYRVASRFSQLAALIGGKVGFVSWFLTACGSFIFT